MRASGLPEGFRYLKHARKLLAHLHEHCDCHNRKPTKRTYELLQFYFGGWVSEDELDEHLAELKKA